MTEISEGPDTELSKDNKSITTISRSLVILVPSKSITSSFERIKLSISPIGVSNGISIALNKLMVGLRVIEL